MGSSTPAIACVAFDRTLNRGATGDDVSALQAFLMHTGDLQGTSTTGFFGSTTEAALKAWQAKQGIATSGDSSTTGAGVAGPKTRAALETSCLRMKMDEQNKMRIQEKRVASSTPPQTPQGSASGPQSNASSLGHVSSLMASGAAAVWEGYLSLFGGQ
jgi:murein L,D-transpeptidase YcbB/YkuD